MSKAVISKLGLAVAAALFSTGGAVIKATNLNAWQVACFRSGTAAAAILLLIPAARRHWSWRAPLIGTAYAATMVFYVTANKLTTAANAIFLQSTAPLYLLLLGPWLLREKIRRADVLLILILAVGLALFFLSEQAPIETAPNPLSGNFLAAASGLTWALTIAGLRWVASGRNGKEAGLTTVVTGNTIACSVCLPMALPVTGAVPSDWLVVGYLGLFQIGLAYVILTRAVRHVPALEASLLLLLEPALNPVWAWIMHGERPALAALAGGGLVLAGTIGRMLRGDRR